MVYFFFYFAWVFVIIVIATQTPQNWKPQPTNELATQPAKGPITHRPILPRHRSVLDVVLDALVGDGPDRRYALICQQCAGHNGMALAEEFEFLGSFHAVIYFHNYQINLHIVDIQFIVVFTFL